MFYHMHYRYYNIKSNYAEFYKIYLISLKREYNPKLFNGTFLSSVTNFVMI